MSAALAWYVNGKAQAEVGHRSVRAGEYLGHLWLVNTGDRALEYLMISDKRGRAMFSTVINGERDYSLCLGTINPGGRGSCHAWVNRITMMEGPLQIIAEEMVDRVA